jgi:hypothetical protein
VLGVVLDVASLFADPSPIPFNSLPPHTHISSLFDDSISQVEEVIQKRGPELKQPTIGYSTHLRFRRRESVGRKRGEQ